MKVKKILFFALVVDKNSNYFFIQLMFKTRKMFQKHKTILETVSRYPFSMLSKCQVDVKNVTKYCRLPPKKQRKKSISKKIVPPYMNV